ncbi:MAG: hypothetical protein LLG09_05755 [Negativicutes bacterium]|nr:hypothetical protein [Negativicutes bacterium]
MISAKQYQRQVTVAVFQVGPGNLMKASALLRMFQEICEEHLAVSGMDHKQLAAEGMAFLLTTNQLNLRRQPSFGENLTIITEPLGHLGVHFYRSFRLYAAGEEIGHLLQLSVLVDFHTHRLLRPAAFYRLGIFEDRQPEAAMQVENLQMPADLSALGSRNIYYSDLDYNSHLNNTIYADILSDFWPLPPAEHRFSQLQIQYVSEAFAGDVLQLQGSQVKAGETFYLAGSHQRGLCFKAKIR